MENRDTTGEKVLRIINITIGIIMVLGLIVAVTFTALSILYGLPLYIRLAILGWFLYFLFGSFFRTREELEEL